MRFSLVIFCVACAAAKPAPPPPANAPPAANDLNSIARADYADARKRVLEHLGPVLVVGPAKIALIDGTDREEFELAPPAYHELKTIAHLALGLHSLYFGQQPPREKLQQLREAALQAPLPEPKDRQRQIVQLSLELIDGSLELRAYESKVAPLLLANALDAAKLQIADLDRATARAKEKLGPRFDRLHVIVVGAHMAREGEISMQYFGKLFGEPEGQRIVFAEGLWDEPSELSLLATHILDSSVGAGFFNDPRRMHRDRLSDAAAAVLSTR